MTEEQTSRIDANSPLGKLFSRLGQKTYVIALVASGLVFVVGGAALFHTATRETQAELQARVDSTIESLTEDLHAAESSLDDAHKTLLDSLSGAKVERTTRDTEAIRALVLRIAATSSSTQVLSTQQGQLDERYGALDPSSRTLTDFLPAWVNDTAGTTYELTELGVQVTSVAALDYSYTAIARLDPVIGRGGTQFLLVSASTNVDGTLTAIDVQRVSGESRDAFLAPDDDTSDDADASTASPSPAPESETPAPDETDAE